MRIADDGKISVGTAELISLAHRKIARIPDSVKPENGLAGAEETARVFGNGVSVRGLSGTFTLSGDECVINATAAVCDGGIFLLCRLSDGKRRPSKNVEADMRAEGFILGYLLAYTDGLTEVHITVRYIDRDGTVSDSGETVDRKKLTVFFEKCRATAEIYGAPELERIKTRLPSLAAVRFPYPTVREGQREFMQTAYRSICRGVTLCACAPTGTGKTVSVLYPALRALGNGVVTRVFYLTPKTTTAEAARDCLLLFSSRGTSPRSVILTAKERLCREGSLCRTDRDACPRSDMTALPDAVLELFGMNLPVVGAGEIETTAEKYRLCPHELSLAYSELCDIVICDINYLFSPDAYIRRYFTCGGDYLFLVDEAHNLPERAREMYSAELSQGDIESLPGCLSENVTARALADAIGKLFSGVVERYTKSEVRTDADGHKYAAIHTRDIPSDLYGFTDGLIGICDAALTALRRGGSADAKAELRDYVKRLRDFSDVANEYDGKYECFMFLDPDGEKRVKLFCVDPSGRISAQVAKGRCALFFSATLTPADYYRATLGAGRETGTLEVSSPFDRSQVSVSVMDRISTRQSERADTLGEVCRVIAATASARRGSYMVFSPSYAYCEALAAAFSKRYPRVRVLVQRRGMSRAEQDALLAELSDRGDRGYVMAFCVMGGIYSEGIDLAGDALIGAVIVGVGMPFPSFEREAIAAYYDEKSDAGKAYAYIYPGMNKVLQAAGRVIRREDDRGVIVLIDDRFADPVYRKSIPTLWRSLKFIPDARALNERLRRFWAEGDAAPGDRR